MSQAPQTLLGALLAFKELIARLRPSKALAAAAILVLLVTGALESASIAMLVPLLEALTGSEGASEGVVIATLRKLLPEASRNHLLLATAGTVLGLIVLKNLTAYLATRLTTRLRGKAVVELRRQLLDQMLHTPLHTLESKTTGDLADLMLVEAAKTSFALDLLIYSTQRATMGLSYLSAILLLSWQLTLLTAALGAGLAASSVLLARRILRHSRRTSEANSSLARRVTETFGGLRLVRTTHNQEVEARRFGEVSSLHAALEAKATQLSTISVGLNETLGVAGAMGVTAFASHFLLQRGEFSVAQFLAFGFGLMRLLPVLNQLHSLQASIIAHSGSTAKLLDWLSLPSRSARTVGSTPLTRLEQGIEIDSLCFRYGSGTEALRDLSCFIPAGSFFAIVGSSGSGKSTLANLMLRLLEPTSGHIRFDGKDYWDFSPREYHRFVAYVEQDPFLFHATIAENVAYGVDASREQIMEALRTVQLDHLVSALPQGIDTMIGERGATLSGGQRQRLAIARALVRSPQLLILDEPTSALDPATEREVVDAIEAARVGRTAIVIAHRMGTIARADFVLHLEDGRAQKLETRHLPGPTGVEQTWAGAALPNLPPE